LAERRSSVGYLDRLVGAAGRRVPARAPRQIAWRPAVPPGRLASPAPEGRPSVHLVEPEPARPGSRPAAAPPELVIPPEAPGDRRPAGTRRPASSPQPRSAPELHMVRDGGTPANRADDGAWRPTGPQPFVAPPRAPGPAAATGRAGTRPGRRRGPDLPPEVSEQVERAIDRLVARSLSVRPVHEPAQPAAPAARPSARPTARRGVTDAPVPSPAVVRPLRAVPPPDAGRGTARPLRAPQVHIGSIEVVVRQAEQQRPAPAAPAAPARPEPVAPAAPPARLSHRPATFGHGQG
jgi:hypothetical protein